MKPLPILSIITVASGDSARLAKTLASLIHIPNDFEHITVIPKDDAEGIKVWKDFNKTLDGSFKLCHDSNIGIYAAMNTGALAAEGKYLVFWNAGDISLSVDSMLQLSTDLKESSANWLVAQGTFDWISVPPITLRSIEDYVSGIPGSFISHPTVITNRITFISHGMYAEDFLVSSDSEMTIKLWKESMPKILMYPIVIVDRPNFAAKYQRTARIEQFIMTTRNFKGVSRIRRFRRISTSEIRSFLNSYFNRLGDLSTKRNSYAVDSPSDVRKISKSASNSSFGRSLLCDAFQLNVLPMLPREVTLQIAVVGGSMDEPELEILQRYGFEYQTTVFGVDESDNYFDLDYEQTAPSKKYDLILCSQVLEHIWNHSEACKSLSNLTLKNGLIWVSCPQSNRFHGSPNFYTSGFTHEYLRKQFLNYGNVINSGSVGTERLYKATHLLPSWLSVRAHIFPLLFTFEERSNWVRPLLALRYTAINLYLGLQSKKVRSDARWATESWILVKSDRTK